MSGWPTAILLLLIATGCLGLALLDYRENSKFEKYGETALVQPIDSYIERTTTTKKRIGPDEVSVLKDATMSYVDKDKKTITFSRLLSDDILQKFRNRQPVYVEYIPGELNSERFKGETSKTWMFILLFLGFLGGAVYVLQRPRS